MSGAGDLPTPHVPISWGELIDKLTILEIKRERLGGDALVNVRHEHALLSAIARRALDAEPALLAFRDELRAINGALWNVEDRLREMEAAARFDDDFVALARSVYRYNDERARLKRDVNALLDSEIVEEKSYHRY